MIILDTNVISALMRPNANPEVLRWLDQQPRSSVWTTSVTVMELRYGLNIMPAGRRRDALVQEMEQVFTNDIQGRIALFDSAAAEHAAELLASRRGQGRGAELRDTMIAGIALATRATLATRNTAHFADLDPGIVNGVVNPWTE